jgi:hypothetical protein
MTARGPNSSGLIHLKPAGSKAIDRGVWAKNTWEYNLEPADKARALQR